MFIKILHRLKNYIYRFNEVFRYWLRKHGIVISGVTWSNVTIEKGTLITGDLTNIFIGKGTKIESGAKLSNKYGGIIRIGNNCQILSGAMILTYGGNITIGDFCGINPYTILYGHGNLNIGNFVRFAAQSLVIPANHSYDSLEMPIYKQPLTKKGIRFGNDIWVGAGVKILDGVDIGDGVVIGSGSVVTKSLDPYTINVGIPCKLIRHRKCN